jgi:hypothetical protein
LSSTWGLPVAGSIGSFEADDHAADAAAAFADFHPRVAGLGQPDAGRISGALRAADGAASNAAAIAMMKAVA